MAFKREKSMAFTMPSRLRSAVGSAVNQWEFIIDQSRELTILSRLRSPRRVDTVMVTGFEVVMFPAASLTVAVRVWVPFETPLVSQVPE